MSRGDSEGATLALDRMGRIVNIRTPGAYDEWFGRAGLICPECRGEMRCYRSRRDNTFVRHNGDKVRDCWEADRQFGWRNMNKALIRAWLVTYLKDRNLPVEENVLVGKARAALVTKFNGKPLAIQLHLDEPSEEYLNETAQELSNHGYQELWLMHHRHWIGVQPTVSISFSSDANQGVDERLTVRYGLYYQANGDFEEAPAMTLRAFLDAYFRDNFYFANPQRSRPSAQGEPAKKILASHDSWHWYRQHRIQQLLSANKTLEEKYAQTASALNAAKHERDSEVDRRISANRAEAEERARANRLDRANGELKAAQQRSQEWIREVTERRLSDRFSRFGLRGLPLKPAEEGDDDGSEPRPQEPRVAVCSAVMIILAASAVLVSVMSHLPGWWSPGILVGSAVAAGVSTWLLWRRCWAREAPAGTVCEKKKTRPLPLVVCEHRHHSATRYSALGLLGALTSLGSLVLLIAPALPH